MIVNVLEYLEQAEKIYPNRIALKDIKNQITYKDLVSTAKIIGSNIAKRYNCRNTPIAVCIGRNIQSVILFFGVIYSGNFYVPLDTTLPLQRIETILSELCPEVILSSDDLEIGGLNTVQFNTISTGDADPDLLENIRKSAINTDPLYTMYTSGSTGKPKGILVSHRSVINLVEQFENTFKFPEYPIFGNQAPFDFDVSVKDIYNSIHLGGTVVVIPKQYFSATAQLVQLLNKEEVNTIIWSTSALRIVKILKTFSDSLPEYLKLIMFSGEVMPVNVLNYWKSYIDATYVNLYGPTEITCNCTYHIIKKDYKDDEVIPIGTPFRNTDIILYDWDNNCLVKDPNVNGEICVRSTSLAHGYYKDLEKTDKAFVQNPLHNSYHEKVYKTGDIGYYNKEHELCFLSRKDHQVKIMGHRIELGEIEATVNAVQGVDIACCVLNKDKNRIVLFYQCSTNDVKEKIMQEVKDKLPKFMHPSKYVCMELPLNSHGKINRLMLQKELK